MKFITNDALKNILREVILRIDQKLDLKVTSVTSANLDEIYVDNTDPRHPVIGLGGATKEMLVDLWKEVFEKEPLIPDDLVVTTGTMPPSLLPTAEGTPPTTIDTDQWSATIDWTPEVGSGGFEHETMYTATITITPKSGYTLEDVNPAIFTIDVDGAIISYSDGIVTIEFPSTDSYPVEDTPEAEIDFIDKVLTNLDPYESYTINENTFVADAYGEIPIDGSWFGSTISIIKDGVSGYSDDSEPQSLGIPSIPSAPSVGKTDSKDGTSTGTITGVTTSMEYSSDGVNWSPISGTTVTGLGAGSYFVHLKAVAGSSFTGHSATVTIGTWYPTPEATPVADIDFVSEKLIDLVAGASYSVNGTSKTADSSGAINIESAWFNTSISIIKKSSGDEYLDSSAQSLPIPPRPGTPDSLTTDDEFGKIGGLTTAMEYQASGASSWTTAPGTEVSGLAVGAYFVRVKAVAGTSFASLSVKVDIHEYIAPSEGWTLTSQIPSGSKVAFAVEIPLTEWVGYDGTQTIPEDLWEITSESEQYIKLYAKFVTDDDFVEVAFDVLYPAGIAGPNKVTYWGFYDDIVYFGTVANGTGMPVQVKLVREAD